MFKQSKSIMKKRFSALCLAAALMFGFVSCDKDSQTREQLLGAWSYTRISVQDMSPVNSTGTLTMNDDGSFYDSGEIVTLLADFPSRQTFEEFYTYTVEGRWEVRDQMIIKVPSTVNVKMEQTKIYHRYLEDIIVLTGDDLKGIREEPESAISEALFKNSADSIEVLNLSELRVRYIVDDQWVGNIFYERCQKTAMR